jgi:hypothetical protein
MARVLFDEPVGFNEYDLLVAGQSDSYSHNLTLVLELRGQLDLDRLGQAVRFLGARHETCRTAFAHTPAGWRRLVYAESSFDLEVLDLSSEPDAEAAGRALVAKLFQTPFDRARAPLVRLLLLRLADGRYWLISHCDHVVTDGLGYASWLAELVMVYSQLCQGLAPSLPPVKQPRDYVAAVESTLAPLRAQPGPWCEPYPADGFALRGDTGQPDSRDPAGARAFVDLGPPEPLEDLARTLGVSRSAPLLAALALGLRELAASNEVGFTLIRSGRRAPEAQSIVGCLAWGDAWQVRIEKDDTYATLLHRAEAFLRDTAPWRMLYIPAVSPPTRRIVLNINRYNTVLTLPGLMAFPRPDVATEVVMWAAHDVLMQVFPLPGAIHGVVRYRKALLTPAAVQRLCTVLRASVLAMAANPTAAVPALV